MKPGWVYLLIMVAMVVNAQTPGLPQSHDSLADFGLTYSLPNEWVLATKLIRKQVESGGSAQSVEVLLAAVYVPNSDITKTSPFFSLVAYRQPGVIVRRALRR